MSYSDLSWHNFAGSFIAKTWCVLTIHSINVLYSAPLVTHTVSSCKLFIDLCSRGKKKHWPRKEIMFCNLYKPIHSLVRVQPVLCHIFRKGHLQGNPQWKQGKPLSKSPWCNNLDRKKKMLCSFDWIQYNLCPLCGHFPSQNRWFQRGHVMVTRYDWMAMCNWAEGSLVAFWTAELVNDMHGNYWFWQRTSKRPLRKKANWEEWEQMENGRLL